MGSVKINIFTKKMLMPTVNQNSVLNIKLLAILTSLHVMPQIEINLATKTNIPNQSSTNDNNSTEIVPANTLDLPNPHTHTPRHELLTGTPPKTITQLPQPHPPSKPHYGSPS